MEIVGFCLLLNPGTLHNPGSLFHMGRATLYRRGVCSWAL